MSQVIFVLLGFSIISASKFIVLGDFGIQNLERLSIPKYSNYQQIQRNVAVSMGHVANKYPIDFVVSTGDNFYPAGVDNEFDEHFETNFQVVYSAPSLQVPWYFALGNHDYKGNITGQLHYKGRRWNMPARNYEFSRKIIGNDGSEQTAFFFVIDTNTFLSKHYKKPKTELMREQLALLSWETDMEWLESRLKAIRQDHFNEWIVVFGHHPIFNHTGSPEPEIYDKVMNLLERYRVSLYVCGHAHVLSHFRHKSTPNCAEIQSTCRAYPTDFIITGAGARVDEKTIRKFESKYGPIPALLETDNISVRYNAFIPGFVLIDLKPDHGSVQFYNQNQQILYEATFNRLITERETMETSL